MTMRSGAGPALGRGHQLAGETGAAGAGAGRGAGVGTDLAIVVSWRSAEPDGHPPAMGRG
ncbi:MAG TPA: hypothetical protein VH482_29595 [Thermomicrobiales bacterium]